ncbi:MAG TPA: hypothetical protein VFT46_09230 [Holophagaceae bacterium]|nr:hypothetical protein [Holophagaceae bacterium]
MDTSALQQPPAPLPQPAPRRSHLDGAQVAIWVAIAVAVTSGWRRDRRRCPPEPPQPTA